ncbi:MAG: helix-turn-helix transcriptional regulator [Gemmatimonadota bacterium]|nr:helix-turn-helix transcriptional regulator [Gemmatimonadota bacterium]
MNDDQRVEVGKRLQKIRGSRDQRTFADAVDSVQQTISKYERGEIPRSWLFLARLAEEEGVDLNRLLTGDPNGGAPKGAPNGGSGSASEPSRGSNGNGRTYAGSEERRTESAYAAG